MDGLTIFQSEVFPRYKELFQRLSSGQNPDALLLTCSDSRIVSSLITQTAPGELFLCRNAGNIAPAHGSASGGVCATIEYAVKALQVRDIIVCGHTDCGAMKALLYPEMIADMPSVQAWLHHAERALAVAREKHAHLKGDDLLDAIVEENVIAQLGNLRTHPAVAARESNGRLNLHGWVYEIETGAIRVYDELKRRFVPLVQAAEAA